MTLREYRKEYRKVFFYIIILVLFLVLYFLAQNRKQNLFGNLAVNKKTEISVQKINSEKIETDYKNNLRPIFYECLGAVKEDPANKEKIDSLKARLLSLKVPSKFKGLHLDLVFALIKMENFIEKGNNSERLSSLGIIEKIKINYTWLN